MIRLQNVVILLCGTALLAGCEAVTYVAPDTMTKVAVPSSPYYSDYTQYQKGKLSEDQVIDRVPHVALLGDSLSRNFHVSFLLSSIWRAKLDHGRDWFVDDTTDPGGIDSIFQRIDATSPVVASEYASVGGWVDGPNRERAPFDFLTPLTFTDQVNLVLAQPRLPDLIMIWLGHNNIDWVSGLNAEQRRHPDSYLRQDSAQFRGNYARELARLLDAARKQDHRTAIVVFGVINFRSFFEARATAERMQQANPDLFPYLEADYSHFESMKPEYRENMIRLALMMNGQLRDLVGADRAQLPANVHLEYSDALATVNISAVDMIHPIDAWHPSPKGHETLAEAAYAALLPSLKFLGIKSG